MEDSGSLGKDSRPLKGTSLVCRGRKCGGFQKSVLLGRRKGLDREGT